MCVFVLVYLRIHVYTATELNLLKRINVLATVFNFKGKAKFVTARSFVIISRVPARGSVFRDRGKLNYTARTFLEAVEGVCTFECYRRKRLYPLGF